MSAPPQRPGMPAFPWREAMAFGLGALRLSPAAFWAMTPRELALAIEGARGPAMTPPHRASLEAMIAAFPDEIRGAAAAGSASAAGANRRRQP